MSGGKDDGVGVDGIAPLPDMASMMAARTGRQRDRVNNAANNNNSNNNSSSSSNSSSTTTASAAARPRPRFAGGLLRLRGSAAASSNSSASVGGGLPPAPRLGLRLGLGRRAKQNNHESRFAPLEWNDYFDEKTFVDVEQDRFCCYWAGQKREAHGPVVFVLVHGGGHSALSWAVAAKTLKATHRVLAFDMRGHGYTECQDEKDFSSKRLVQDIFDVVRAFFAQTDKSRASEDDGHKQVPPIVIAGHSLGGALVVRAADEAQRTRALPIVGMAVVDVVEGSALKALVHMRSIVSSIPKSFPTLERAIQWVFRSRTVRNLESARVSTRPQLVEHTLADGSTKEWRWRLDLLKTEPFWEDWFIGLSQMFLSITCPKFLLLADQDRLDDPLMVARMQGKFQLEVLADVGHIIQEDKPSETAGLLVDFVTRYRLGKPAATFAAPRTSWTAANLKHLKELLPELADDAAKVESTIQQQKAAEGGDEHERKAKERDE